MDVNINEISSTVRTMDSESLLTPQVLNKIVEAVLSAVKEQEDYRMRMRSELQIKSSVREGLNED